MIDIYVLSTNLTKVKILLTISISKIKFISGMDSNANEVFIIEHMNIATVILSFFLMKIDNINPVIKDGNK
jgi:hypothetical protein